jgi:hypothetical protein
MEMLIFFFLSLFAGVVAAYYSEKFTVVSRESPAYETNQDTETLINRLLKITRQIH